MATNNEKGVMPEHKIRIEHIKSDDGTLISYDDFGSIGSSISVAPPIKEDSSTLGQIILSWRMLYRGVGQEPPPLVITREILNTSGLIIPAGEPTKLLFGVEIILVEYADE